MKRYPGLAVVTGASSGTGMAFARRLRAEGIDVVLVARRRALLEALAKEIGGEVVAADLSTAEGCAAVARAVEGRTVGMFVHAAGYGALGPFEALDLETQRGMIGVNATAFVDLAHRFLPGMLAQGSGAIVVVSSISAFLSSPWLGAYSGTKAFVQSFAEGLASEVSARGVDVLAVCPGPTRTGFQLASGIDMEPKGPFVATPEEVVETALRSLGRRRSVVHGLQNALVSFLTRFVPRALVPAVAGQVLWRLSRKLRTSSRAG
jgi:uncharacterized protein